MRQASFRVGVLLALALALGVPGCGRKGPPLIPHAPEAVRPQALGFRACGNTLALTWRYPAPERQPEAFRVFRARPDEGCPTCPPRYVEVGKVARQAKEDYLFEDEGLTPGAPYVYSVVPVFERGVEGPPSEPLRLTFRSAPPPAGLVAVAVEGGVRLFWEPAVGASGYAVHRAEGAGEMIRLGDVEVPPYLDATVAPGRGYRYAVATIDQAGEGPKSEAVEVLVPE